VIKISVRTSADREALLAFGTAMGDTLGGGGGSGVGDGTNYENSNARADSSGAAGSGDSGNPGAGGSDGNGGTASIYGGGGGGLIGSGRNNNAKSDGESFILGGKGGNFIENTGNSGSVGGFGGGGGCRSGGGPGGGGYSGGGGGGMSVIDNGGKWVSGGGGGSYGITSFTDNGATNTGNGSVTITFQSTASLYPFTTHTFTNSNVIGPIGPSFAQCIAAYSGINWVSNSNFFNMTTQGYQLWTVPKTGTYTINAYGAGTPNGGIGGRVKGNFILNKGDIITIVCGQMGTPGNGKAPDGRDSGWYGEGGGGGTYVALGNNQQSASLLCVAGGGGGLAWNGYWSKRQYNSSGGWMMSKITDSKLGGTIFSTVENGWSGSGGAGVAGSGLSPYAQYGNGTESKPFIVNSNGGIALLYNTGNGGFGGGGFGGSGPGGGGGGYKGGDFGGWVGSYGIFAGGEGGTSYILDTATNIENSAEDAGQHGKVIITIT